MSRLLAPCFFVIACSEEPAAIVEPAAPVALTVLAASSLTETLPKVAAAWGAQGAAVSFSFDSSSKLAKQVVAGAPADVLFTADAETMDGVAGLLVPGSRRELLGNSLVVVVPTASDWVPSSAADLLDVRIEHMALAGENVPAGKYARAALQSAGVWTALEAKGVAGDNVRTTLAWVSRGEAEAGIVYATDARIEPLVKVAFAFPTASHPPIVYPAAVVATSAHPDVARAFLDFCASPEATAIFEGAGFAPPPKR